MVRSSLSVLALLTLVACGPADLGEASQDAELVGTTSAGLESCRNFDTYTAALGTRVVDCLGTMPPNAFTLDKNGYLRRTFEKCLKDDKALQDIDDLLGVQLLEKEQPGGVQCIAGRWAEWQKLAAASNLKVCPTFTKTGVINAPTPKLIEAYAKTLPTLPAKEDGTEPADLKVNYTYSVKFATTPPRDQKCKTPAECAQLCVGGFPGTWVKGSGEAVVLDPLMWLVEASYSDPALNPFMRAGYYHKMSFYGDDPGVLYGHRNRKNELCSRFYDGVHYVMNMEEECYSNGDLSTCMSRCGSIAAVEAAAEDASP